MENASKALLIAGSILIVILLIAMGVRIFSSTQGTADSVELAMNATEIATFNGKFTAYAGSNKSAAQVRSLANIVIAHNATNEIHKVKFEGKNSATDITDYVSELSGTFTIKPIYDENTQLIVDIDIQ